LISSTSIPSKDFEPVPVPADARPRPLIHPVSAALLLAIDALWAVADWAAFAWIVTIPLSFLAVAVPTFLVQRHLNRDEKGRAFAVSSSLGVLAAIPTPVTGTFVGTLVLLLAGLRSLRHT
jgi:hypothetical protein